MRVRFTTTAGPHEVGVTFLATNMAPLLDMNKQFLRSTVQTGPTPGFTFYPSCGQREDRGAIQCKTRNGFSKPAEDLYLQADEQRPMKRHARAES